MLIITVLVFVAVFAIAALLLSLRSEGAAAEKQQAVTRLVAITTPVRSAESGEALDLRKREPMSSIPLLNRWLSNLDVAPKLRDLLAQANLGWTPARLLLIAAAFCMVPGYLVYLRTETAMVSVASGALAAAIPFAYVLFRRNKRFGEFERGLPGALDLMVSGLRSGHSLISAMNLVGREVPDPIGREFRIVFDEQNYGLDLRTAMHNLALRVPIQDVRIVVTAILIQRETGGNLAEVLDKCSYLIRERFRLKKEISVRTAQGRLTGMVLTVLPVALGFLMFLVNPDHISLLWKRPLGLKMLYSASIMTVFGGLIIRKIVRIRI